MTQNVGDQWLAAHGQPSRTAMPASPFASRGSGRPIHFDPAAHATGGNPIGVPGLHATAARPPLEAADQSTRATTDSHREARPARIASGDSSSISPFGPSERAGHSAPRRPTQPHTISISMAIRVEAARWRKREAGFLRWGTHRSEPVFLPFRRIPPFVDESAPRDRETKTMRHKTPTNRMAEPTLTVSFLVRLGVR